MTDAPPKDTTESSFDDSVLADSIQSPELDPKTLIAERRAIKNGLQAWSIFKRLQTDNRDRNATNAEIAERYKGRQPFDPDDIQSWQSNFPILFLAGLIDKVVPALTSFIENAKSLTQSKLKDESAEGISKSEQIQEKFTKYVRRWDGWRSFCSSLCQEICLMGYAFAIRTDEYNWRPTFYRQDEAYLPEGTPQFSQFVQVLGIKQDFLIHELTEIIQDREAAKGAKWKVDNVVEAINKSRPRGEDTDTSDNERRWVDAVREGNLGASFETGSKVVKAAHVLAIETAEKGKVTHYIVDRERENKTLLSHEMRFDSMRDVVTLFTLEPGNGKFYGSKGLGRMLVNFSVAMDVVVNETVNQLRIAGLIPIQIDTSKGSPPVKIRSPFIEINAEAKQFDPMANFPANVTAAIALIDKLQQIAEVAAQQYIPNTLGSDSQGSATATEKRIDYTRELQSKAAFIARFAGHFAEMIGMMQRAMCNPETNDEEAMAFQKEVLGDAKKGIKGICTEEELQEWAQSPAAEVLQDLTAQESQAKIAAANDPELIQSPLIDQKKRIEMKLEAMLPIPLAQSLLRDDAVNPDDETEQIQKQIGETEDILDGASQPVADRDNHEIHLKWLLPDMQKGGAKLQARAQQDPQSMVNDPKIGETLDHFQTGIKHGDAHVMKWERQGGNPQQIAPYKESLAAMQKQLDDFFTSLQKMRLQQQQEKMKAAATMASQAPQMPASAPQPNGTAQDSGDSKIVDARFSEKIAASWIGQYDKLQQPEKTRLEQITGLSPEQDETGAGSLPDNGSALVHANTASSPTTVQPGVSSTLPPSAAVLPPAAPEQAPGLPTTMPSETG